MAVNREDTPVLMRNRPPAMDNSQWATPLKDLQALEGMAVVSSLPMFSGPNILPDPDKTSTTALVEDIKVDQRWWGRCIAQIVHPPRAYWSLGGVGTG